MTLTQYGTVLPETSQPLSSLDFGMLQRKLMDSKEGEGWTAKQAMFAISEYRRFLSIIVEFGNAVPNTIMDTVWHYHILDTRAYAEDCQTIAGEFIHHYPYFGMNGAEDEQNLFNAFEETKRNYFDLFGEHLDRENDLFGNAQANHCHKCKGVCNRCNRG